MVNYLKIKKRKITLSVLLIVSQMISGSYAINNRGIEISESSESNLPSKYGRELKLLIANNKQNETYLLKEDVEELERFIEETFDSKNIDNLTNLKESNTKINTQFNEIEKELINNDIENKKANKEDKEPQENKEYH